jgi:hypothetical protein
MDSINPPKYMSKIVPLIGSAEVGPLGVLHLPRLWLKVSLDAKGLLADGYPAVGTGFDQMVIDGLRLQKEAVVDYIAKHKPTYPEFESWIKQQPGVRIDAASIPSSMLRSEVTITTKAPCSLCSEKMDYHRISGFGMR